MQTALRTERPVIRMSNPMRSVSVLPLLALTLVAAVSCRPYTRAAAQPADAFSAINLAGEVTQTSVILQSRLVNADSVPTDTVLPGFAAWGYFEIASDSTFAAPERTRGLRAMPENDYRLKTLVSGLQPGRRYYYRPRAGRDSTLTSPGPVGTFETLPTVGSTQPISFVMISCMHYERFHGIENPQARGGPWAEPASGEDQRLGYPAFLALERLEPAFVISNGDNVYYDHPNENQATTRDELRAKWHRQLAMPRMRRVMERTPFYFLKDDHDYRYDDADTARTERLPSHALGVEIFREQVPVVDPDNPAARTYRTHRLNANVQLWFLEGRDYRTAHSVPDGPGKTLWGEAQREWLKRTLLESDAVFRIIVSPTPLVGPDDARKRDNHTNPGGFRHEGDAFIAWLTENGLMSPRVFVVNGDRHWQYHSVHPSGLEEFGSGAFVSQNARRGREPGDSNSTDPRGLIRQPFSQPVPTGGMLQIRVDPAVAAGGASILFSFYDQDGKLLYATRRYASESGA